MEWIPSLVSQNWRIVDILDVVFIKTLIHKPRFISGQKSPPLWMSHPVAVFSNSCDLFPMTVPSYYRTPTHGVHVIHHRSKSAVWCTNTVRLFSQYNKSIRDTNQFKVMHYFKIIRQFKIVNHFRIINRFRIMNHFRIVYHFRVVNNFRKMDHFRMVNPLRIINHFSAINHFIINIFRSKSFQDYKALQKDRQFQNKSLPQQSTSRGGRMGRTPASRSRRSGNLKIVGSSLEPVALKPCQVKPMTLKLILFTSWFDARHY